MGRLEAQAKLAGLYATTLSADVKADVGQQVRTKGRDKCGGVPNPISRPRLKRGTSSKQHLKASEQVSKRIRKGKQYQTKAQASDALRMALIEAGL